jgi:hypothetical protein
MLFLILPVMAQTSMLEKMIDFVYGALIFLILVGIAFAVYQIFWAKTPAPADQNFDSVFAELAALKKDACFDVVIRPAAAPYVMSLYPWGNAVEGCGEKPCLCLEGTGSPVKCRLIPDAAKDCLKGPCVSAVSHANIIGSSRVQVCNSGNMLSVKSS